MAQSNDARYFCCCFAPVILSLSNLVLHQTQPFITSPCIVSYDLLRLDIFSYHRVSLLQINGVPWITFCIDNHSLLLNSLIYDAYSLTSYPENNHMQGSYLRVYVVSLELSSLTFMCCKLDILLLFLFFWSPLLPPPPLPASRHTILSLQLNPQS